MFHQWNPCAANRKIPAPNTIKMAKIMGPFWERSTRKSTGKTAARHALIFGNSWLRLAEIGFPRA
jgi:hypothetical protein